MKSVLLILFILLAGFQINAQSGIKLRFNQNGDFKIVPFTDFKRLAAIFEKAKTLWALAFFHIPLPEYTAAWNNRLNPPIGVKNEDECSPEINTGMFAAMLESGDVIGTFVGHDHINDYIGVQYGIALAYGRITKTMGNPADPKAGGRVILMKEGERKFDTWIREGNGNKVLECSFPGSFNRQKQKSNK